MDEDKLKVFPRTSNEVWIEIDGLMVYIRSTGDREKPCLTIEHNANATLTKHELHKNGYKLKLLEESI